jgi:hypothetical protein
VYRCCKKEKELQRGHSGKRTEFAEEEENMAKRKEQKAAV